MKKIAIIGGGALGATLAVNLKKRLSSQYTITGILTRTGAEELTRQIGCRACWNLDELLLDDPDYVVEIAGISAVAEYGAKILKRGIDLIVVSVGALANPELYQDLLGAAEESGSILYIASGAIGGFDLMRTFALMGNMEASIENVKAPQNLEDAPYLSGRMLSRTQPELVFQGTVQEAIAGFPKNVNVAVAADLAVSAETDVLIRSVPGQVLNSHIIRLKSQTAEAEISISSAPDPKNPRSSTFTAWSVIALLENLNSPIRFF